MQLKELLRLFSYSMSFTIEIEATNEYIYREGYEDYPDEIDSYADYYIEGIYDRDGGMVIMIAEYEDK